jgi:hypothetical protein
MDPGRKQVGTLCGAAGSGPRPDGRTGELQGRAPPGAGGLGVRRPARTDDPRCVPLGPGPGGARPGERGGEAGAASAADHERRETGARDAPAAMRGSDAVSSKSSICPPSLHRRSRESGVPLRMIPGASACLGGLGGGDTAIGTPPAGCHWFGPFSGGAAERAAAAEASRLKRKEVDVFRLGIDELSGSEGGGVLGRLGLDGPGEKSQGGKEVVVAQVVRHIKGEEAG